MELWSYEVKNVLKNRFIYIVLKLRVVPELAEGYVLIQPHNITALTS